MCEQENTYQQALSQQEQDEQQQLAEIHRAWWKVNCYQCGVYMYDIQSATKPLMQCRACAADREPSENYGGIHG